MILRFFTLGIFLLTLVKVFAVYTTNYSLFGDEAQYWLWSKELSFGYLSKPPLIAWVLHVYTIIFGESFESLKLFSLIVYFFTALVLFDFVKKLGLSNNISVICCLSFLVMPAVSVSSFLISTDVLLLLFWTVALSKLIDIRNKPSLINFVILGIMLGLSFLAKYAAIYFLICGIVLFLCDKKYKKVFSSNKINLFICLFVVLVILFPNLLWNASSGWLTFEHTSNNANLNNINPSLSRVVVFLFTQALMIGPILFFGLFLSIKKIYFDKQNIFLLCFSVPVIFIVLLESFLVGANANWAATGLICFFVFLFRLFCETKIYFIVINYIANFIFGLFLFLLIAYSSDNRVFDRINGIEDFSKSISNNSNQISNIVVTDRLLYSSLSYQLRDEGFSFFMPLNPKDKITKHFQINSPLSVKMSEDFLFIGGLDDISYLSNPYNVRLLNKTNTKFLSEEIKIYEVFF